MKTKPTLPRKAARELFSELLLLADGTVLAHNLTPTLAALLEALDLRDASLSARVITRQQPKDRSPAIGQGQCKAESHQA